MGITNATLSRMKVNPNRNIRETAAARRAPQPDAPATSAATSDFQASTKLAEKLAAMPAVRAEKVARAKALIADPNYPKAKTIRAIAQQLAQHIQPPTDSR